MILRHGDGTHHKKRLTHDHARGMTPIEKNVIVVDRDGNELHRTYAKRAKGLVKKGRAHFVGDDVICLTDPSGLHEEDNHMDNTVTIREIFDRITQLHDQLASNDMSLKHLHSCLIDAFSCELDDKEKISELVDSICSTFACRDRTLQNLLRMYEKMYDDLKNA